MPRNNDPSMKDLSIWPPLSVNKWWKCVVINSERLLEKMIQLWTGGAKVDGQWAMTSGLGRNGGCAGRTSSSCGSIYFILVFIRIIYLPLCCSLFLNLLMVGLVLFSSRWRYVRYCDQIFMIFFRIMTIRRKQGSNRNTFLMLQWVIYTITISGVTIYYVLLQY